jgi:polysaccharide export outer membrane protein
MPVRRPARAVPLVAPAALALLLAAPPARADAPPRAAPADAPSADHYKVGPRDQLQVFVYGEPEVSGTFPVDDEGRLHLPLLPALPVRGLTADQVAAALRVKLGAGYIQHPSVNVWVAEHGSQPVPVLGAVARPGLYYLKGHTTVLELLSEAGGVLADGVDEVRVTHGGSNERVSVIPYQPLVADGKGNLELSAGDVVQVPDVRIPVLGSVGQPAEVPFREGLTVSACIAAAGGASERANLGRVYLLRDGARSRVNLRRVLAGKDPDPVVRAGDRVFVKESSL